MRARACFTHVLRCPSGSQKETSSQRPPLADWLSEPRDPKNLGVEDENVRLREEVTDLRTQLVAAREQIRLLEMELEVCVLLRVPRCMCVVWEQPEVQLHICVGTR